jgi:SAM-dependent methyltransferase
MKAEYVHGYSRTEARRLRDQARSVQDSLHHDTYFPAGSSVLEAGCGVGAQTTTLLDQNPDCRLTCVDVSAESLARARAAVAPKDRDRTDFHRADIYRLPFESGRFDHVFVCFVLEHLADPPAALAELVRVLRPGGGMTAIEGDHGSCYWHPETEAARAAWRALIEVQADLGGDSLIGRRLYPLLTAAGLSQVRVSPRMMYMDAGRPAVMDGFVLKTIVPMVETARRRGLARELIDRETFERGLADLDRLAYEPDGVFCYTFFKATAVK